MENKLIVKNCRELTESEWLQIMGCCKGSEVEKIEWAEGRFLYRCKKCKRTRAMEKNGMITWRGEVENAG